MPPPGAGVGVGSKPIAAAREMGGLELKTSSVYLSDPRIVPRGTTAAASSRAQKNKTSARTEAKSESVKEKQWRAGGAV